MTTPQTPSPGSIRSAIIDRLKQTPYSGIQTERALTSALTNLMGSGFEQDKNLHRIALNELFGLFRAGLIGFGQSIYNCDLGWCYLTEAGRLVDGGTGSRDPYHPGAYIAEISQVLIGDPDAQSYVTEGVTALNAGLHRAAAVLLGVAAESILLDLRDALVEHITIVTGTKPKKLAEEDHPKQIDELVEAELKTMKKNMSDPLRDRFVTYWKHIGPIRITRNAGGHPNGIDAVTASAAHANYLYFHEIARLLCDLRTWIMGLI